MEKPEYKKHKSWGSLQISRVSGQVNLYGSHVTHQHFIEMRILASERKHDLGQDWYYDHFFKYFATWHALYDSVF